MLINASVLLYRSDKLASCEFLNKIFVLRMTSKKISLPKFQTFYAVFLKTNTKLSILQLSHIQNCFNNQYSFL